jgi:hypothetical protein
LKKGQGKSLPKRSAAMSLPPTNKLEQYFGKLPDPREGQNVQHPLLNIVITDAPDVLSFIQDYKA